MKKIIALIVMFSSFVNAQVYEVKVDSKFITTYTEKGMKFFEGISDPDQRKWNIEQNTNPPILNYRLVVSKDAMNTFELEKINNNQEGKGEVKKASPGLPFDYSYIDYKENKFLRPVDVYGKKYIERQPLIDLQWEIIDEYKEIMGYKVQRAISKFLYADVEIWFTKEIPINFIPAYNIKPIDGFVLELNYTANNEDASLKIAVNVTDFKEIKKYEFKTPKINQGKGNLVYVTSEELDKIYEVENKKRNDLYNQSNGVDKK